MGRTEVLRREEQVQDQQVDVIRMQQFENGSYVAVLGTGTDDIRGIVSLKPAERLIRTRISDEAVTWMRRRVDSPTLTVNQEPLWAVVDMSLKTVFKVLDTDSKRLTPPYQPYERIEGSPPNDERSADFVPDSPIILGEKAGAKERMVTLIKQAIADGSAQALYTQEDTTYYAVCASAEMVAASRIGIDPDSKDEQFRKPSELLKPNEHIVVGLRNGVFTFAAPQEIKPKLVSDTVYSLKVNDGKETFGAHIKKVASGNSSRTAIASYALDHFTNGADRAYPTAEFAPPTVYDPETDWGRKTKELHPGLVAHLETDWRPGLLASRDQVKALLAKVPEGETLTRQDVTMIRESYLAHLLTFPAAEWPDRLAQYFVTEAALPKKIEDETRDQGLHHIERQESALEKRYRYAEAKVNGMPWEEIPAMLETIPDPNLRASLQSAYKNADMKAPEASRRKQLTRTFTAGLFDRFAKSMGQARFAEEFIGVKPPVVDYDRVYERADRLLTPDRSYSEIIAGQVARLHELMGENGVIYETPQSKAQAEKLAAAGYPEEGKITWMSAEGVMELGGKERFVDYGRAISLASAVTKGLYTNPEAMIKTLGLEADSEQARQIRALGEQVKLILDYRMPSYLPKPTKETPGLDIPNMTSRPDFARRINADDTVTWISTELENSYGGPGMQEVIMAGYPEAESNLSDQMYTFMQEVPLPRKMSPDFDRNKLSIVMTEDWAAYATELQVFLKVMQDRFGVEVDIHTIEELAHDSTKVPEGFVFHFAYAWNFFKNPESHHIQLMKSPEKIADALGVPLTDIVRPEFVRDGAVDEAFLNNRLSGIQDDGDALFNRDLTIPGGFWRSRLVRDIYQPGILDRKSENPEHEGRTVPQIGRDIALQMQDTAKKLYAGQGKTHFIFNDPLMGNAIHTKMGLSIFHLPGFTDVMNQVAEGPLRMSAEDAERHSKALTDMTARTIPLMERSGNEVLDAYLDEHIAYAIAHKDEFIIKISVDPEFGSYDWGSRSLQIGSEMTDAEWRRTVYAALASNSPFVLQDAISNTPYDQPRASKQGGRINAEGTEQIGIFNRSVDEGSRIGYGELVTTNGRGRLNPFTFAYFNPDGTPGVKADVANAIMTIRPYDDENVATKVHGSTDAAMVPVVFK